MGKTWSWDGAARRAGVARGRRFNCGAMALGARPLEWWRADGQREAISAGTLTTLTVEIAGALRHMGVGPGDRVASLLGRTPVSFALPLATWRLGALVVPLFSGFGVDAIRARLEGSGTRLLVCDAANLANALEAQRGLAGLEVIVSGAEVQAGISHLAGLIERSNAHLAIAETTLDSPATIMYTSGTSGAPKGCVIPHRGLLTLWPYVVNALGIGDGARLLSTADAGWSFGLYTTGVGPMSLGATRLLLEGGFDPELWWAAAQTAECFTSAPTGYRQLALADVLDGNRGRLQSLVSAGEPLPAEVSSAFVTRVGVPIRDTYGLTELGMVLANQLGPDTPEAVPGCMGTALPGFDIGLLDASGRLVDGEGEGRLAASDNGWLLGTTYWERDELWQQHLQDGWWATEDVARRDELGRYWYLGRADDIIVTAGYNVAPAEIENALLEHPLVIDAGCIGVPDDRKGQVVSAYVVLAASSTITSDDELVDVLRPWVGERVGWHAAPRRVTALRELPRTESGKLRRANLGR